MFRWKAKQNALDARFILNKRRQNKMQRYEDKNRTRTFYDARNLLNEKRRRKSINNTSRYQESEKFSPKRISHFSKPSGKSIQYSSDGNIRVTSRLQNTKKTIFARENRSDSLTVTLRKRDSQNQQRQPIEIEDDLETMTIDDLPDIKPLPTGFIRNSSTSNLMNVKATPRQPHSRSLAEELMDMKNTMVADFVGQKNETNCKLLVSNLLPSVSREDLIELFSYVGTLKSVNLLSPGIALVEFMNFDAAKQACELYHMRLLDGQPMQCVLQADPSPRRISISQRLGGRIENPANTWLPSNSSLHLPSYQHMINPNNRYNNVQFTVKLPFDMNSYY